MNIFRNKIFVLGLCLGGLLPREGFSVRPLSAQVALVAGDGTPGFRDGRFTSAYFETPLGMAASDDGNSLFVADSGNNRIRVIHLDRDNLVGTLTGQSLAGKQDGKLLDARFFKPHGIVTLPGNKLLVNDFGNKLLRLVDITNGTVSTLGGGPVTLPEGPATGVFMGGIMDMAYLPAADSVFFSQPDGLFLKRLDMKTRQVTVVLHAAKSLARPGALCASGDSLFLADNEYPVVFEMKWKEGALSDPVSVASAETKVFSLAKTGEYLYALQAGLGSPLIRLLPQAQPVTFNTVWGDRVPNPGQNYFPVNNFGAQLPIGFVGDPLEEKKLYIANPAMNIVSSFRDLLGNRDVRDNPGMIVPPSSKPPHTFRILLVGDSRLGPVGYDFPTDYNTQKREGDVFPPQISFSERLELELNALAALEEIPSNFDVFILNASAAQPLFLWPAYMVPDAVRKRDIDLVLIFQPVNPEGVFPFRFYFMNPITPEGIPNYPMDMEYLLKPPLERIPRGDAGRFYDLCKDRKLVHIEGKNFVFDDALFSRPEIHPSLVQLYGKPMAILDNKLSEMRTSAGNPVSMVLCSAHTGLFRPNAEDPEIWKDVAGFFKIPFLDLNDEVTALDLSFYPLASESENNHLNPDGHLFFSLILLRGLIQKGLIPWGGVSPLKGR